ncbi:hypothetical protein KP78_07550 [Jeotgalibacillus soli]|uniref:Uncharacterized protein n=1 Tax=Jeotgalibacillus soli TaxID=889306 RepID=A0A0C2VK48_9BACL|nr:hypothetical protein KP78_07550 [Jeotgalibacillus soli]
MRLSYKSMGSLFWWDKAVFVFEEGPINTEGSLYAIEHL